jgi:hypothetical protein
MPHEIGLHQPLSETHPYHVDDLSWIEFGDSLAYRTDAATGTARETAIEMFSARQFGNFRTEGCVDLLTANSHKETSEFNKYSKLL